MILITALPLGRAAGEGPPQAAHCILINFILEPMRLTKHHVL